MNTNIYQRFPQHNNPLKLENKQLKIEKKEKDNIPETKNNQNNED